MQNRINSQQEQPLVFQESPIIGARLVAQKVGTQIGLGCAASDFSIQGENNQGVVNV
jgi:hypothetical protein